MVFTSTKFCFEKIPADTILWHNGTSAQKSPVILYVE